MTSNMSNIVTLIVTFIHGCSLEWVENEMSRRIVFLGPYINVMIHFIGKSPILCNNGMKLSSSETRMLSD